MKRNFENLNINFDIDALKDAYDFAVEKIGFEGEKVNCISLTHPENLLQADTRGIFWTRDNEYEEYQVEKYVDETSYRVFEPLLMTTYFKNIYDTLSKHYKLGRVRVLKLNSRSCLSYHRDPECRLHIPIITNPGALMIVDNQVYHMKANGSTYYMNTKEYHSALNGGSEPRVHLVATVLDDNTEDELYEIYGGE